MSTIEEIEQMNRVQLAAEDEAIRQAIEALYAKRRIVRALLRGREQAAVLIAQRDRPAAPTDGE